MAILVFVGIDKTGKTTLRHKLHEKTNRHIIIDRFTPCQKVYGEYYGKKDTPSFEDMIKFEQFLKGSPIPFGFVWVTADLEDVTARFHHTNEKSINLKHYEYLHLEYARYLHKTPLPVFTINTSQFNIESCVGSIIEYGDMLDKGLTLY